MADDNATPDPASANQVSAASQSPAAAGAPDGFVEVARLNGALAKIQELTLANRTLTDQLNAKSTEVGALQAQIAQKEAEWQAQSGEFTSKLAAADTEKAGLSSQLTEYQVRQQKVKLITELGRPELLAILDVIPNGDEAAMRASITNLANFAAGISTKREQELVSGILPIVDLNQNASKLPTTEEGWTSYINSFPLGSAERKSAFDAWHTSLIQQK